MIPKTHKLQDQSYYLQPQFRTKKVEKSHRSRLSSTSILLARSRGRQPILINCPYYQTVGRSQPAVVFQTSFTLFLRLSPSAKTRSEARRVGMPQRSQRTPSRRAVEFRRIRARQTWASSSQSQARHHAIQICSQLLLSYLSPILTGLQS